MPAVPAAYAHWQSAARKLLEPLAALMRPGHASLVIAGPASDHDAQADRMESFARPLLLAAHYLQTPAEEAAPDVPDARAFRTRLADWFRAGLVIGSDPKSPHYWGPDANYHQHHVEIGLLCIGLQLAPRDLWDPLTTAEKDQVARWLGTARGNGIVNNNHYFMGVHILEFLGAQGYARRTDRPIIDEFLNRLELMHRGGGWFEDGINQAYDHYNAYAFHFYGLMWARLHGKRDPSRARRWRDWARPFVRDYQHFFAASGEHPAFGRSICYRFNCLNVFGMTLAENCCDLPPGMLRRLCTRNLDFFLSKPAIFQEQGCLSIGWTDRFEGLMEVYSCSASPYWAAKGFAPLLLPPTHAFWTAPEEPLPSERGDHAHVIKTAGLVVRSTGGAVEIINAGSQISNLMLRYGAWKWSKTAYRTGVSFTCAFPHQTNWSVDSALTLQLDDGTVYGRHSTVAVEMDNHHVLYSTNLGFKTNQANTGVESAVWWRAGWLLQLHTFEARQPVVLRLGGYALPLTEPHAERSDPSPVLSAWSADARGTVLQPLAGFAATEWDTRLDDTRPRAHVAAPYHVAPVARENRLHRRRPLETLPPHPRRLGNHPLGPPRPLLTKFPPLALFHLLS
ncbi:MAG: DUF2264 domain-containing protein [Verrucomicrobia bacterium]|nr:DUF2264 domain-containing protein [Verrucomicrobiota bacterium]